MSALTPLSEQEIERHLSTLPRMQMSARGDELFFSKLNAVLLNQSSEARAKRRDTEVKPSFFASLFRTGMAFGVGALAVVIVFTGISYQDSVTRGSLLYPVKQTGEQLEGALAFTTEQKVTTELRFADRRLNEAWNIVGDNPEMAFLVVRAYAADIDANASLSTKEAQALRETLADMNNHVNKASQFVESQALDAQVAVNLLDAISNRADAQVASLKEMKTKTPTESRFAVSAAAHSQESYVVSLVVAREEIRSLIAEKGPSAPVKLADFSNLVTGSLITQSNSTSFESDDNAKGDQARRVLSALQQKMDGLNANDRAVAQARIVEAQRALSDGKIGTAYGLSIALTKELARDKGVLTSVIEDHKTVTQTRVNGTSQTIVTSPVVGSNGSNLPNGVQLLPQSQVNTNSQVRVQQNQRVSTPNSNVFDLVEQIPNGATTSVRPQGSVQINTPVPANNTPTVITPSSYAIGTPASVNQQQQIISPVQQPAGVQIQQPVTSPNGGAINNGNQITIPTQGSMIQGNTSVQGSTNGILINGAGTVTTPNVQLKGGAQIR